MLATKRVSILMILVSDFKFLATIFIIYNHQISSRKQWTDSILLFMFHKNITLTKVTHFSQIYYHTLFQDPKSKWCSPPHNFMCKPCSYCVLTRNLKSIALGILYRHTVHSKFHTKQCTVWEAEINTWKTWCSWTLSSLVIWNYVICEKIRGQHFQGSCETSIKFLPPPPKNHISVDSNIHSPLHENFKCSTVIYLTTHTHAYLHKNSSSRNLRIFTIWNLSSNGPTSI